MASAGPQRAMRGDPATNAPVTHNTPEAPLQATIRSNVSRRLCARSSSSAPARLRPTWRTT